MTKGTSQQGPIAIAKRGQCSNDEGVAITHIHTHPTPQPEMIVAWNVRGLNKFHMEKAMKVSLVKNETNPIATMEHRVKEKKAAKVVNKLAQGWLWCHSYASCARGRIWIEWNPRFITYTVLANHAQLIHGRIRILACNMDIYINCSVWVAHYSRQKKFVQEVIALSTTIQGTWITWGDFKAILNEDGR